MPADLSDIILRAMAKRPEDRYQSLAELRNALGIRQDGMDGGTLLAAPFAVPDIGLAFESENASGLEDFGGTDFQFEAPSSAPQRATDHPFDMVAEAPPTEQVVADFDLEGNPNLNDDFGFAAPPKTKPQASSNPFGFDSLDTPVSTQAEPNFGLGGSAFDLNDDFGFANQAPAKAQASSNPFGLDSLDAPSPSQAGSDFGLGSSDFDMNDDFGFASPAQPAPTNARSFGLDVPDDQGVDFGFGAVDHHSVVSPSPFGQGTIDDFNFSGSKSSPTFKDNTLKDEDDPFGFGTSSQDTEDDDIFGSTKQAEPDLHDPTALEEAFERELNKPDANPFAAFEGEDPASSADLDGTNPDSGFHFGVDSDDVPKKPTSLSSKPAEDPFGFASPASASPAPADFEDDFAFEEPTPPRNAPTPVNRDPDIDFRFGLDAEPPATAKSDPFGFNSPADEPDDFGFGGKAAPANDDFGFGSSANQPDDFGFGSSANQPDDFGFGSPANEPDDFGFGNKAAPDDDFGFPAATASKPSRSSDPAIDDFGFGAPESQSDDFAFDAPAPEADPFGFSGGTGEDFGFQSPGSSDNDFFGSPAASSKESFDFGGDANDFGFQAPKKAASTFDLGNDAPDDFGFAAEPADDFGFGTSTEPDDFGFGSPASATGFGSGADDFGFGDPEPNPPNPTPADDPFGLGDDLPTSKPALATTEDGAFSFEPDDTPATPVGALPVTDAAAALAASIASAEAAIETPAAKDAKAKTGKSKPSKPKVVRKFDIKVLAVTAALLVLILGAGGFWWISSQQAKEEKEIVSKIEKLSDRDQLNALKAIEKEMAKGPSDNLSRELTNLKQTIRDREAKAQKQIATLLSRAKEQEKEGLVLVDGSNDAFSSYARILENDPNHAEAKQALTKIQTAKLAEADEAEKNGSEIKALELLSGMAKALPKDKVLTQRHAQLKQKLASEREGQLQAELDNLFNAKRYSEMEAPLVDLEKITPGSKYHREMIKNLTTAVEAEGQVLLSQKQYEQAEKLYALGIKLNPENTKLKDAHKAIQDQRLTNRIEALSMEISGAMDENGFSLLYKKSQELAQLDPGNRTATTGLERVEKELATILGEAETHRNNGQFKKAAVKYKEAFDINGDPDTQALYQKYESWTPPTGMAFVALGEFSIGNRQIANARPPQTVYVSNYFLDQYEVTNKDYKAFVDANPQWAPGRIDPKYHDGKYLEHWVAGKPNADDLLRPVTFVSWYAASAYASWAKKRLPSEAEWEKAARGGTVNQSYWWGNYSDAKRAVYELYPERKPAPVGSFPANPFEIYEILGNVEEWVLDTYDEGFYSKLANAKDPVNEDEGPEKVVRGGSYQNQGKALMVYLRHHLDPRTCKASLGFRCAREAAAAP